MVTPPRSDIGVVGCETPEIEATLLGIVAHEIRNPLSLIRMAAGALLDDENLLKRQVRTMRRITNAADRIQELVDTLLDVTRTWLLHERMPIHRQPTNLKELSIQAIEELQMIDSSHRIVCVAEEDVVGNWDPHRLLQVISNLVANALHHSVEDAPVHIVLRSVEDSALIEVHNEGAPISPEILRRLFDPFRRLPSALPKENSLGLGLYIVHQVVVAHGGSMGVRSSSEAGTTFTVRLPASQPEALGELERDEPGLPELRAKPAHRTAGSS